MDHFNELLAITFFIVILLAALICISYFLLKLFGRKNRSLINIPILLLTNVLWICCTWLVLKIHPAIERFSWTEYLVGAIYLTNFYIYFVSFFLLMLLIVIEYYRNRRNSG